MSHGMMAYTPLGELFQGVESLGLVNEQQKRQRKGKLDAIGTLLEKAVVNDPYKAPNSYQCVPTVFINQKLYGKATEDDPINNINVVKKIRNKSTVKLSSTPQGFINDLTTAST